LRIAVPAKFGPRPLNVRSVEGHVRCAALVAE
jgi:hypothetical protein